MPIGEVGQRLAKEVVLHWWLWLGCVPISVLLDASPSTVLIWLKFQELDAPVSYHPSRRRYCCWEVCSLLPQDHLISACLHKLLSFASCWSSKLPFFMTNICPIFSHLSRPMLLSFFFFLHLSIHFSFLQVSTRSQFSLLCHYILFVKISF